VQQGQEVLIVGASGAVGSLTVQLAKAFGAEVTGVCGTSKVDMVQALGADHVIDYTRDDFSEGGRYDLILDIGGEQLAVPGSGVRSSARERSSIVGGEVVDAGSASIVRSGRTALSPIVSQKLGTSSPRRTARTCQA